MNGFVSVRFLAAGVQIALTPRGHAVQQAKRLLGQQLLQGLLQTDHVAMDRMMVEVANVDLHVQTLHHSSVVFCFH